jgi:hypothetical protein
MRDASYVLSTEGWALLKIRTAGGGWPYAQIVAKESPLRRRLFSSKSTFSGSGSC